MHERGRRALDEAEPAGPLEGLGHQGRRDVGHSRELGRRDRETEHGGNADDRPVAGRELAHQLDQRALEAAQHVAVERAAHRHAAQVERVALRDGADDLELLGRDRAQAGRREIGAHGGRRQAGQLDPGRVALEVGQHLAARRLLDLLATGEHEQRGQAAPLADEEARQQQRGGVRHVGVVEDDYQRGRAGHALELLEHGHETPEAIVG